MARALKTETEAHLLANQLSIYINNLVRWMTGFSSLFAEANSERKLLRKEVIQPQVPLRLPCYDFTPVTKHSLGTFLPCGLEQPLLEHSTPMV